MTANQLKTWLAQQLKLAEPLDAPSTLADPQHVATTAAKRLGLLGHGNGELLARAGRVASPFECAAILIDCLASLPSDGPADPNTLAPSDVARILGVKTETVRGWIRTGELKASNIASGNRPRWIIPRQELESFLANRQQQPAPARTARRRAGTRRF